MKFMRKLDSNQFRAAIAGLLVATGLGIAHVALAGTPISVVPMETQVESASAALPARHHVQVDSAALFAMQPGESFSVKIPGHDKPFEIVFDRIDSSSPQFAPTWVGHLQGHVDEYRTIITASGGHAVGRISTPEGDFHLETVNGVSTLVDLNRAGLQRTSFGEDALPTLHAKAAAIAAQPITRASAGPSDKTTGAATNSVIDVMVLYNPSFVTATGNAQNTITNLISIANQAMIDSGVAITFRLVATQLLSMSDTDDDDVVLLKMTYPSDPNLVNEEVKGDPTAYPNPAIFNDPVYTNVPALRDQYGADLVVAIRQFSAAQTKCGIAWILTGIGAGTPQAVTEDAPDAYAVVSYGSYQVTPTSGYVCDNVTMAHEMGHNLGSAHDYAHAEASDGTYPAVFSYSYGYGFVNEFATVMAANYITPATVVAKYSSPNLTCDGYVCGVAGTDPATAADNVMSLNATRTEVAQFRPTAASVGTTIYTPATGYWWNPAEPGRGYNIEENGNNLFMAAFLYDPSGRPTWYGVGPGAMVGNTFTGTLETYSGGQTLTGAFQVAQSGPSAGTFSITFTSATQATISWPGGLVPIQRYDFGPGGSETAQPSGTPQAGWWWAPTQGGRGYAIEVQGGSLFLAGYMYDANGNPIWYASGPTPLSGSVGNFTYQGEWLQFGNGQTLTGAFQPSTVVNSSVGPVTIQFSSTTSGTMSFPNRTVVNIQRYSF